MGWALVLTARRLGVGKTAAWLSGWTLGVTTFAWAQTRGGSESVLAAFLLIFAFQLALRLIEAFDRLRSPSYPRFLLLGGILAAALFASRTTWLAVFVLNVWLALILRAGCSRLHEWRASAGLLRAPGFARRVICVLLPQLAAVLLVFAYNHWRFGDVELQRLLLTSRNVLSNANVVTCVVEGDIVDEEIATIASAILLSLQVEETSPT